MPGISVKFFEIPSKETTARYLKIQALLCFPGAHALGITGPICEYDCKAVKSQELFFYSEVKRTRKNQKKR